MSAPTIERTTITEPGVYDMTDEVYHGDPVPGGSLSSSGARKLLPPSCPAIYRHEADQGEQHKRTYDFGHAAHLEVFGVGAEVVVIDAPNYLTKAAKEQRSEAYTAGKTPLLIDEYTTVQDMAAALRRHPFAAQLIDVEAGKPEQSLFWQDAQFDVWRRARLDWLPDIQDGRRSLIVDYKTTNSAATEAIGKSVFNYGYHQQAAWYLDAVSALSLATDDAKFLFVFQQKTAPYLVNVVELDDMALRIGRDLNRQALEIYRDCTVADRWPGFNDDDILRISLPVWAENAYLRENS